MPSTNALNPTESKLSELEQLSDCSGFVFDFEDFIKNNLNLRLGHDPTAPTQVCKLFQRGQCRLGSSCPFKHVREKGVVCKHWLRGLCKKGDNCEFLHEYNLKKMPECWFFSKFGECTNPECLYLHIDPNSKIKECLWYKRGFCKHGPNCRNKHVRLAICQNYLFGFCPLGPDCKLGHPKWIEEDAHTFNLQQQGNDGEGRREWKPLSEMTCFKCGEKGHLANRCPASGIMK